MTGESDDLVARLRKNENTGCLPVWACALCSEAADEIERLRAKLSNMLGKPETYECVSCAFGPEEHGCPAVCSSGRFCAKRGLTP